MAPDELGCGVPSLENDPCAHTRRRVDGKLPERSSARQRVRGCFCAPRNLRFPVGEELAGKSPTAATTARRSGGEGFREENNVIGMKHDHQKSKLGFPFGSDTM